MVCLRVLMLTAALLLVGSGSSNAAESGATPVSGVVTGGLRKHHAELRGSEPLGNRLLHSARHGDVAATTAVVSLRLTAPSKGQTVTAGSSVTVAWQSSGSGVTLDMTLCLQRVCNMPITTGLSSLAEQYTWDVPDGLSDSSSYQIELASTADNVTVLGPMFTVSTLGELTPHPTRPRSPQAASLSWWLSCWLGSSHSRRVRGWLRLCALVFPLTTTS